MSGTVEIWFKRLRKGYHELQIWKQITIPVEALKNYKSGQEGLQIKVEITNVGAKVINRDRTTCMKLQKIFVFYIYIHDIRNKNS